MYDRVRKHFDDGELVTLSMAIVTINAWNRLALGFRIVPGTYEPKAHLQHAAAAQ